ncbi:hydrolase [Aureococcus anophagefferens]|nr:hydrolase [Aureococcus anophagefferens]
MIARQKSAAGRDMSEPAAAPGPGSTGRQPAGLRGYTRDAAFAAFREDDLGAVAPGYAADLSVFDVDLAVAAPAAILEAAVVATVVGGRVVYAPDGSPFAPHRAAVDAAPPDLSAADAAAIAAAGRAWEKRYARELAEDRFHAA